MDPVQYVKQEESLQSTTLPTVLIDRERLVLIVDDYDEMLNALEERLNRFGFPNIAKAQSVDQALEILRVEADVVMIVSDYEMPEKNGSQFFDEVRKIARYVNTPFFLRSSSTDAVEDFQKRNAPFSAAFSKSFSLRSLKDEIEGLLIKFAIEAENQKEKNYSSSSSDSSGSANS